MFISLRTLIGNKLVYVFNARRQPRQIEIETANERRLVGFRRRLQSFAFEPRQDEAINGVLHPRRVCDRRRFGPHRLHVSPMPGDCGLCGMRRGIARGVRPGCALVNPAADQRDLRRCERRTIHRHARLVANAGDAFEQTARAAVAGDDGGTRDAAFQRRRFRVEPQLARRTRCAVTLAAMLGEDRRDVAGEINRLSARRQ